MTRIIALEEGLDDVREFLQSRGFHTVSWGEETTPVDAVVYTGRKLGDIFNQDYNSMTSALADDPVGDRAYGVLLVNAQDKTPQEVYEIIKNRVYEHFIL